MLKIINKLKDKEINTEVKLYINLKNKFHNKN